MTSLRSKDFCSSSPHATRRFELPTLSHAKSPPKGELLAWLGLRDGNITFSDELDFDPSELDIVYEDIDPEEKS